MRDAETNAVLMKSFAFAVRCVNLRKYLIKEKSEYWIELLQATEYITPEQGDNLLKDCRELIKLLTSIVKTTFAKVE